jgi:hypothetical protein
MKRHMSIQKYMCIKKGVKYVSGRNARGLDEQVMGIGMVVFCCGIRLDQAARILQLDSHNRFLSQVLPSDPATQNNTSFL